MGIIRIVLFTILLFTAGIFLGCKTQQFSPEGPPESTIQKSFILKESYISTPVSFNYNSDKLEERLKKAINKAAKEFPNKKSKRFKEQLRLDGKPVISTLGDMIYVGIPFHYFRKKEKHKGFLGRLMTDYDDEYYITEYANIKGRVSIRIPIEVQRDWSIKTNSDVDIEYSNFEIGGFELGLAYNLFGRYLIGFKQSSFESKLSKEVDDYLNNHLNFKKEAKKQWAELQKSIEFPQSPDYKIRLKPYSIGLSQPFFRPGKIDMTIFISGLIELGNDLPETKKTPFPELVTMKDTALTSMLGLINGHPIELNLNLSMPYDTLDYEVHNMFKEVAKDALNNEGSGVKKLVFDNTKVFPAGDSLVIKTEFQTTYRKDFLHLKKAKGDLYFITEPKVVGNCLVLDDLDYQLQTKNLVLKIGNAFMKDDLLNQLRSESTTKFCGSGSPVVLFDGYEGNVRYRFRSVEVGINGIMLSRNNLYLSSFVKGHGNIWIDESISKNE
ncbi:DUF4403 family protein [Gracilimonas sediminicola]|uniref:DUF4403 family protein n=1 Tax=Gracilimonas sediminicola TaxID=2952158 RepID=UPI0038D3B6F6